MQNFLELKCLADDVDALSMFINASFLNIISFDEVDRGLGHEKKNILLDTICFLRKTITDDSN